MDQDTSNSSRRTVLKTIGAGAVSATTFIEGTTAEIDQKYQGSLRGTPSDPITQDDISELRMEILGEYKQEEGEMGPVLLRAPDDQECGDVFGYNFKIGEGGEPKDQYVRYSDLDRQTRSRERQSEGELQIHSEGESTRSRIKDLHEKADEMLNGDHRSVNESRAEKEITTASSSIKDWSDWVQMGRFEEHIEYPPHGVTQIDFKFAADPDSDIYGVRTYISMESGENQCGVNNNDDYCNNMSQRENKGIRVEHDWSDDLNGDYESHWPDGQMNDEEVGTTVSLGVDSGKTSGVSYSHNTSSSAIEIDDKSSTIDDITRAHMDVSPSSRHTEGNITFEPGSLAKVDLENDLACVDTSPISTPLDDYHTAVNVSLDTLWGSSSLSLTGQKWGPVTHEESESYEFILMC